MVKDYHYILRCVTELRPVLIGQNITEAFSQEKDQLYFHVPSEDKPNRHLIISCNSQLPYILFRDELHRAKKNTFTLFHDLLPAKIIDVRIAANDRIVNISTDKHEIFILIRGGKSNIIVTSGDNISGSFKKIQSDNRTLLADIFEKEYLNDTPDITFKATSAATYPELKKEYPFVSRSLYNEIVYRASKSGIAINIMLKTCVEEIISENIFIGYDNYLKMIRLLPETFDTSILYDMVVAPNYNEAVRKYIARFYQSRKFNELYKFLNGFIDKQIHVMSNRLNNLKFRLEKGCKDNLYYKYGQLLLVNISTISPGSKSAVLEDYLSGDEIEIKLDPAKNIQENANNYFDKAKDEKKNYIISRELFDSTRIKYETYINFREKIKSAKQLDDLIFIKDQLNIRESKNKSKVEEQANYRTYILGNKYRVLVGKDSKSNDILTVKIAKQNDYWFHARGYSGSHVVLRVENTKEAIPKSVLNNAASIAAFYSKAKTAKVAPVAYTLRKYVRKNKNMNPGQVIMTKEKVLLVKPEIPKNAEEADNE